jgi:hypothetical protein
MLYVFAQHFRDRSRIGVMPIGSDLFGALSGYCFRTLEKRCAAVMSRFGLSIESINWPS